MSVSITDSGIDLKFTTTVSPSQLTFNVPQQATNLDRHYRSQPQSTMPSPTLHQALSSHLNQPPHPAKSCHFDISFGSAQQLGYFNRVQGIDPIHEHIEDFIYPQTLLDGSFVCNNGAAIFIMADGYGF